MVKKLDDASYYEIIEALNKKHELDFLLKGKAKVLLFLASGIDGALTDKFKAECLEVANKL